MGGVRVLSPLGAACLAALLAATGSAAAADPAGFLPGPEALPPLVRAEPIARHTPETLWERIDGEAELYRRYGLVASAHASFESPADDERRVEVSVYLMRGPLEAFGIFASYRPAECAGAGLGHDSCLGDYQSVLWQGAAFVLADGYGTEETRAADLRRALEAVAARMGPAPPRPASLAAFEAVASPATVRYAPDHLLGRAALPAGLEGVAGGLSVFSGELAEGGAAAVEAYAAGLEGARREPGPGTGVTQLSGRDPQLGPLTLAVAGDKLAGARAEPEDAGVRETIARLLAPVATAPESR